MCIIGNVCRWFAAIEIVVFKASDGGVPAYRSGRSPLLNSLAPIPDLRGLSLESFVCVVWTGVTGYCATVSRSFEHSEVTHTFQFLFTSLTRFRPLQFFACDIIKALEHLDCLLQLLPISRPSITTVRCEPFDD